MRRVMMIFGLMFSAFLGGAFSQSLYLACAEPMLPFGPPSPPRNGTSVSLFNSWASQLWEMSQGTSVSPVSGAGPLFKISRTQSMNATSCGNNAVDNECDAALAAYSNSVAGDGMQANAIFAGAKGQGTKDNVAGVFIGYTTGVGAGIGTGFYAEGRRDTTSGNNLGAEVRSSNITANAESFNSSGFNSGSLWLTAGGSSKSGCGACVGSAGQSFDVGFGVTNSAALTWAFVSPGFSVDPSGNIAGLGYKVGATSGLSCSGTPSSSFASTNGIVTHC